MLDESIGARVAAERKLRGLTQHTLAGRAHVSLSLVRAVEQGHRPATATLVAAVARALHIDRTTLTGQPYSVEPDGDDHAGVADLRREVAAHGLPPLEERTVTDLEQRVMDATALRQASRYRQLSDALPALIADLRFASFTVESRPVMGLLAETYDNARALAWKLGHLDLAHDLATLYRSTAEASGDPLAVELGESMRAHDLLGVGEYALAGAVADRSIERLGAMPESPAQRSLYGYMHLERALTMARAGASDDGHYAEAERVAAALGQDRDDYRLAFGITNTAIWGVGLAVEALDGRRAIARASAVAPIPSSTPPERVGHFHLDLARAHLLVGDTSKALTSLWDARRTAPEHTRSHPMARETVYALARKERHASGTLRGLAVFMGLDD